MSPFSLFFLLIPLLLVVILAWALRPARPRLLSPDNVLDALGQQRHYSRLSQIQQALQPEDTAYVRARGHKTLAAQLHRERKQIALKYVRAVEEDYQTLLGASRMLAVLSPEVIAIQEWERLKLSARFSWNCAVLRWRLRTGRAPWRVLGAVSDMASQMSYRLEAATSKVGELALRDTTSFEI